MSFQPSASITSPTTSSGASVFGDTGRPAPPSTPSNTRPRRSGSSVFSNDVMQTEDSQPRRGGIGDKVKRRMDSDTRMPARGGPRVPEFGGKTLPHKIQAEKPHNWPKTQTKQTPKYPPKQQARPQTNRETSTVFLGFGKGNTSHQEQRESEKHEAMGVFAKQHQKGRVQKTFPSQRFFSPKTSPSGVPSPPKITKPATSGSARGRGASKFDDVEAFGDKVRRNVIWSLGSISTGHCSRN